jgi:putative heme-binding domain-containing protein
LIRGGPSRWADRSVTLAGSLGDESGAYAIDTLTIPSFDKNDFNLPFRVSALAVLPDQRIAVATLAGDVWLVDGVDEDLDKLTWKRIAAGLYQPLGMLARDNELLVIGRDQLTRLHDLNGDDEIDFYECVTNAYTTNRGHEFITSLRADENKNLYFSSPAEGILKYNPIDKTIKSLGSGIRFSNGIEVSPDGSIVLATAQEGPWTPATSIFDVGGGSFHGLGGPRKNIGKYGYDLPMCYVPRGIDPSAGAPNLLPADARLGPLASQFVGLSSGHCTHYLILRETVDGKSQGGIVPLPGDFLSGVHRLAYNPHDGNLYVGGTQAWQSYAQEQGCLQRIRYTGKPLYLPTSVETRQNGLIVRFNCEIDPRSVQTDKVFCEQWNYLYSPAYGSAEYSVKEPGRPGHDRVEVRSVKLLKDGKSIFVEIPQLHPVMQLHLYMQLKSIGPTGEPRNFTPDLYYTIHNQQQPYTDFVGYEKVAKKPYPKFPVITEYEHDPRLAAQETTGSTRDFVYGVAPRQISAVAGLQFEPKRLRVKPGSKVAITISNKDVTMSHNLVIVKQDRLQSIGEQSMVMAADPKAIAKHYVPDDEGVLALSPVLNPGDQYTIYLVAPEESGVYAMVCTFPGHWTVMRGLFIVAKKGEQIDLPEETPQRDFVKMWMTSDLAGDVSDLSNRSRKNGEAIFETGGCYKCHVVAGKGTKLGPDLTDVAKRFKGDKLLDQILNPSGEINKDFQTHLFLTADGATVAGLIIKEDDDQVHVLPNPLKPEEVMVLEKDDIEDRRASKVSTMPKGLLMTFSKEEILELVSFLQGEGK